jgi:hypothetical protein
MFSTLVIALSVLILTVAGIALDDDDFAGLEFAAQALVKDHQLAKALLDDFQGGIALFFVGIGVRFMLESHEAFGGRAEFYDDFLPFDDDVDFRDTMDMAFGMTLFSCDSFVGNEHREAEF